MAASNSLQQEKSPAVPGENAQQFARCLQTFPRKAREESSKYGTQTHSMGWGHLVLILLSMLLYTVKNT